MAIANFVKKARKNYPNAGIKKDESYWWWKFNFGGGRHMSKIKPSRSQLTYSEFLSEVYSIEDDYDFAEYDSFDELESMRDGVVESIRLLIDETQDKLDNMPEHLQDTSPSGELLTNRLEELENWASNLESVDIGEDDIDVESIQDELGQYLYEGE